MSTIASDARSTLPDSPVVRAGVALVVAVLVNAGIVTAVGTLDVAPDFRALTIPPVAVLSAAGAGGESSAGTTERRTARGDG